jgi:hypothetical protein
MERMSHDWRKSSYSGNGGANCVEAASGQGGVLVRDTVQREGFTLDIPVGAWAAFLGTLR